MNLSKRHQTGTQTDQPTDRLTLVVFMCIAKDLSLLPFFVHHIMHVYAHSLLLLFVCLSGWFSNDDEHLGSIEWPLNQYLLGPFPTAVTFHAIATRVVPAIARQSPLHFLS
jgi:hypothetical protein